MAERSEAVRARSFGQDGRLSAVDRFGVWLSGRAIRRHVKSFAGLRVGDFGCGYDARFVRTVLDDVREAVLVDVALAPDLRADPRVTAIEGHLPDALDELGDASLDVVLCISALEHLSEPARAAAGLPPVAAAGRRLPRQRAELAWEAIPRALGVQAPPEPGRGDGRPQALLRPARPVAAARRGGFRPSGIKCSRHKFGLNTFAACRVPGDGA